MTNQTGFLTNETPTPQIGPKEFTAHMKQLIKLIENEPEILEASSNVLLLNTLASLGYGEGLALLAEAKIKTQGKKNG